MEELHAFLRDNPMKDGIGKEELKSRIPKRSDPRFFGPLLAALEKEGTAISDSDIISLPGRKGEATIDQAGVQPKIADALQKGGMEPPTLKEFAKPAAVMKSRPLST